MEKFVCIHGHFYQPPRENPWLDEVEYQESAYPYHNWNERITAECYAPNAASRILNSEKKIIDIVNNFSKISFNFGPTLLSWLEKKNPESYQAILEADRISTQRFSGHGSAIAQVYNHLIMPLASTEDKRTQVYWGIRDFESRFKRYPEGMWLAETAVDVATLEILAEYGIRFTILAPHQAKQIKELKEHSHWVDIDQSKLDTKAPYLCRLPSGKEIILFFYDGKISQEVAFNHLLENGERFAQRLLSAFNLKDPKPQLVHIATDGETYGHHHRHGEMALAYCLYDVEKDNAAKLTIYGEYLEKFPPVFEVRILENTSWSCFHGIERWRSGRGSNTGLHPHWNQNWREPLRNGLDWLRDESFRNFETQIKKYSENPSKVRNEYIEIILNRNEQSINHFFKQIVSRELAEEEKVEILRLLEMQHNALLMYTSCGWFFDEISGIETVQIMKYAARVIQMNQELGFGDLEPTFIEFLRNAKSNIEAFQDGEVIYQRFVKPAVVDFLRVGAHYAFTSLFETYPREVSLYCYNIKLEKYEKKEFGATKLTAGYGWVESRLTLRKVKICFIALHMGDHNFIGGVDHYENQDDFARVFKKCLEAFSAGKTSDIITMIHETFDKKIFSLWHLFQREQHRILNYVLEATMEEIETTFRQIFNRHYSLMRIKQETQLPLPRALTTVVGFVLNRDLTDELKKEIPNGKKIEAIIEEMQMASVPANKEKISFIATERITKLMERLQETPEDLELLDTLELLLKNTNKFGLPLDLWRAQNIYYRIGKRVVNGNAFDAKTAASFKLLGDYLCVKIT